MPALDHLTEPLALNLLLGLTVTGHGPRGQPQSSLHINVARLTDHAVQEYETARQQLTTYRDHGRFSGLLRGVAALEAALVSTHRALEFLTKLRAVGLRNPDGTPLVPRPRDQAILSDLVRNRIRGFRHAIQHLDDRVSENAGQDMPIMLIPHADRLELEGTDLSYSEWAVWLESLHGLVNRINGVRMNSPAP